VNDLRPAFRAWIASAVLSPHEREAAIALLAEIGGPEESARDLGPDPVARLRALERENDRGFWREMETVHADVSARLAEGVPFEEIPEVGILRALGFHPEESACRRTL
jgi:hypothetical protein